jgi:glutamyl-tRNA reductase
MVLGETEITGQVKHAYQVACDGKLTGSMLNRVFQKSLQTAKVIRTQTLVGRGATSVGSAAVELAEKIFGPNLAQQNIMIMGAGKMGEACVRHLAKRGAKTVLISNRSIDKAEALALEIGGTAIRFEESFRAMIDTDIVVCSTGCPQTVLHRHEIESVMRQRLHRPLVLIDIAVPRNIAADVQAVGNVYLHNIDDLEALVRENVQLRERELERCRAIVDEHTEAVMAKLAVKRAQSEEPLTAFQPAWTFAGQMVCAA